MDISKLPRLSQTSQPADAGTPAGPSGTPPAATTPVAGSSLWCARCNAPNPAGTRHCGNCGAELRPAGAPNAFTPVDVQPGIGAEVWVSAIVGIILMLVGMNFAKWAITTMAGGTYHTTVNWTAGPKAGQEVAYWELDGFAALQDCGLFLFGLAMVLEAIVLVVVHSQVRAKRPLLAVALLITLTATILNLLVSAKLLSAGVLPLMSLLAVAFGGYIIAYEWRLFQHFARATPRA